MKLLYLKRQGGKTTKMIEWLRENPRSLLVVFSHQEEDRLKNIEENADIADRILSWQNYQKIFTRNSSQPIESIAIDNADMLLQGMCADVIDTVTFSDFESDEQK